MKTLPLSAPAPSGKAKPPSTLLRPSGQVSQRFEASLGAAQASLQAVKAIEAGGTKERASTSADRPSSTHRLLRQPDASDDGAARSSAPHVERTESPATLIASEASSGGTGAVDPTGRSRGQGHVHLTGVDQREAKAAHDAGELELLSSKRPSPVAHTVWAGSTLEGESAVAPATGALASSDTVIHDPRAPSGGLAGQKPPRGTAEPPRDLHGRSEPTKSSTGGQPAPSAPIAGSEPKRSSTSTRAAANPTTGSGPSRARGTTPDEGAPSDVDHRASPTRVSSGLTRPSSPPTVEAPSAPTILQPSASRQTSVAVPPPRAVLREAPSAAISLPSASPAITALDLGANQRAPALPRAPREPAPQPSRGRVQPPTIPTPPTVPLVASSSRSSPSGLMDSPAPPPPSSLRSPIPSRPATYASIEPPPRQGPASPEPVERPVRARASDAELVPLALSAAASHLARSTQSFDTKPSQLKPGQPTVSTPRAIDSVVTRSKAMSETLRVSTPEHPRAKQKPHGRAEEPIENDAKAKARPDEAPGPPLPTASPAPSPLPAAAPQATDAPPPVPLALEPFVSQLLEDPSARISLTPSVARMSVDTGEAGRLSVQLRVTDGVTDVSASGPAAPMLDARQNELRVALAQEGLSLGRFDLSQRDQRRDRPEPVESEYPQKSPHVARTTSDPVPSDGSIHIKA